MSQDVHTVSQMSGSQWSLIDRVVMGLLLALATPASADAVTGGTITAGSGFTSLPSFAIDAHGAQIQASSLAAVTATPATPGTGVAINDTFNVSGGALAAGGAATLLTVSKAQLVSAAINAGGAGSTAGYHAADVLTLVGGTSTQAAQITVDTVDGGGGILTFHVSRPGSYSVESATFTVTGGAGTGATFQTAVWGANAFTISTAGAYTASPATPNTPTNGTGSGAGVTVTLSYGLGAIQLLRSGIGYATAGAPTFNAVGGGGSGCSVLGTLGGNGNPVLVGVTNFPTLPANYGVFAQPTGALDCRFRVVNKTSTSFAVELTPKDGSSTLAAGTLDLLLAA